MFARFLKWWRAPPKCRHDWEQENGATVYELFDRYGDHRWCSNRVCLKCGEVDDALDRALAEVERKKERVLRAKCLYRVAKGHDSVKPLPPPAPTPPPKVNR